MWPVPANAGVVAAPLISPRPVIDSDLDHSSNGFFLKDGRKIHIGDCALFQSGNSPAFIGIIRSLSSFKEDYPKLIVNWLYRPADIKLAKGILLEAAPNEVFYSFHKNEISAESLLHPCKVAFLRRGIELPSGISSFVCRRVYDIANKCLWWLTDQDYINERQEEVDQLLDKTQIEMHAVVQSGGRSPKHLNGSTQVQQLKSSSDSVQNSGTSGPMHMKGKRRDKVEQNPESFKREQVTKANDGDSGNVILDGLIRDEVAKITDKGGLVDTTGVDKLIGLMQLDKDERKINLAGRLLLADVIASTSTDRFDCLGRFVQLKGLLVLDDWLQEAHKGKVADSSSPKESDKSFDELVFALLRALEKLPVNLHALQTSNIGKSVNNLRGHKNLEIQKKARSLVDTWKKRVDVEIMKNNDTKFVGSNQAVSWSGKPGLPEATHGGNRRMGDAVSKNSSQSSAFKTLPVKPHGDATVKLISAASGSLKSSTPMAYPVAICTKDAISKISVISSSADLQFTSVKEEKSSGSSQSQSNYQSSSTGPAKTTAASRKDDVKISTSGSSNASKIACGLGRHRKSSNGLSGSEVSGIQKESSFNKVGTVNRNSTSNKMPLPGATSEQVPDLPIAEHVNGHKLIVRLPNPGKSSGQCTSGGSFEELSVSSRASSPSEKHDQADLKIRIKGDACQTNNIAETNAELSNDKKDAVASGEGAQLLTAFHKSTDENGKLEDALKDAHTLSISEKGISFSEFKLRKQYDPSLCSMNALIESCVKSAETCVSLSAGDDLGMNLLASVATEEMLKSDIVCSESSLKSLLAVDGLPNTKEDNLNLPHDIISQGSGQHEKIDVDPEKTVGAGIFKKELQKASVTGSDDKNNVLMHQEHKITGGNKACAEMDGKLDNKTVIREQPLLISQEHMEEYAEVNRDDQMLESLSDSVQTTGGVPNDKLKVRRPSEENRSGCYSCEKGADACSSGSDFVCNPVVNVCHTASGVALKEEIIEDTQTCYMDIDIEKTGLVNENSVTAIGVEQKPPHVAGNDVNILNKSEEADSFCGIKKSEKCDTLKSKKADCADIKNNSEPSENKKKEESCTIRQSLDQVLSIPVSFGNNGSINDIRKKDAIEDAPFESISHEELTKSPSKENEQCKEPVPSKISPTQVNETGDPKSLNGTPHVIPNCSFDGVSKLNFDLNEGINVDEANPEEVTTVAPFSSPSAVCQPGLASIAVSTISRGCPVTVTIAALAKGPFMSPENLSRSRDEPGWKGSAATSAFRPAEPRKLLEMPIGTSETLSSGKQDRPSLDIDLNVADARVVEDMPIPCPVQKTGSESCSVSLREELAHNIGLDLDLNKADEGLESVQNITSTIRRWEPSHFPAGVSSGGFRNGDTNGLRDFDLNNGLGAEVSLETMPQNQPTKNSVLQFLPPVSSLRLNSAEFGNMPSWFPSRTAYPAVGIPPFLSDRGDSTYPLVAPTGAQRFLGSATVGSSFGGDHYRGPVLSSSPAISFTAATPFTHPSFQFPSGFPLNSASFPGTSTPYVDSTSGGACLPIVPSPLVGPANATSSPYVRPYVISLSDSSVSGGGSEGAHKWGRQNFDLNAGPGGSDMEARGERLPSSSHQLSITSQPMFAEEAGMIYQVAGGGFKRKEPEGGWDTERFSYKQSPW